MKARVSLRKEGGSRNQFYPLLDGRIGPLTRVQKGGFTSGPSFRRKGEKVH